MDSPVAEGVIIAGRYRLGPRLGQGGMADVYDAYDERLTRPVAVKLLRADLGTDRGLRQRFEAEARAAARLSHPNVVAVHDTGEDAGRAYIVMERLPGDTVADQFRAGPANQDWLRRVAGEVLAALGAAHAAGIIHRDVKPGNILLSTDGRAKVADFGIAMVTEGVGGLGGGAERDRTATGMVIGTPAYLAPERIDGRPATVQSDLYSVGVVLYEGLTGRKAFDGPTPLAIAYQVRHELPPDPRRLRPDADPRLVAVIGRALARDPAARFDSAGAMAEALDGVSRGGPVSVLAGQPGPSVGPGGTQILPVVDPTALASPGATPTFVTRRPPVKRRRRWLRFVAAAAVAAMALFALDLARGSGPSPSASTSVTSRPAPATTIATTTMPTTASTVATTTPPATAAADPIGDQLRGLAGQLSSADGPQAQALAAGLISVAGLPPGSRADAATSLLAQADQWVQDGQLSPTAYGVALYLLQQAGGTPPTTTTTVKHRRKGGGNG